MTGEPEYRSYTRVLRLQPRVQRAFVIKLSVYSRHFHVKIQKKHLHSCYEGLSYTIIVRVVAVALLDCTCP